MGHVNTCFLCDLTHLGLVDFSFTLQTSPFQEEGLVSFINTMFYKNYFIECKQFRP